MSEVFAIKSLNDIGKIKTYLKRNNPRDYTLFVLGINVGLRASDLLRFQVRDIYENGQVKEALTVNEKKTSKNRQLFINDAAATALNEYYKIREFNSDEEYLFKSRKGTNPICVRSLNRLVKTWCRECRIKGNYGTHTLRKTFGYHLYINNQANPFILPYLMRIFRHSSQQVTLRYIGIEQEDINNMYNDLNL